MRSHIIVGLVIGCSLLLNAGFSGHSLAASRSRKICGHVRAGQARCMVSVLTGTGGMEPYTTGSPRGYGPADWRAAYGGTGRGTTHVAIVTAYDDPALLNDVAVYARAFGLALPRLCTSPQQGACIEQLSQHGTPNVPTPNSSWSVETSLDTETIYGLCPGCHISILEASSPAITSLTMAVDAAVASGATIVSNSYGGPEFAVETDFDAHYSRPGVTMVVSSGDNGYGTSYPAASPAVLAVGGTSLQFNRGRVASESAWAGTGSGCSQYEPKPLWQNDSGCKRRTIADLAADADPLTGAAIYASYGSSGRGWLTLGGTSLAAPLVSGLLANSGRAGTSPGRLYAQTSVLRDITDGANGGCRSYLCRSVNGYDGPTGMGVPSGW